MNLCISKLASPSQVQKGWTLQRDVAPEVQTCQGHLQSCGKGSEKSDYCKGWFQLHFAAGPVFICAGWQGKGHPFMCWLPTKAEAAHAGGEAGLSWVSEHPNSPKTSGPLMATIHPRLTEQERRDKKGGVPAFRKGEAVVRALVCDPALFSESVPPPATGNGYNIFG